MNFLTDWISQIIFFIFLATIISLLIPATSHQKIIKLVFGLIIFLLFLHPLTSLFGINPDQFVESWELSIEEMTSEDLEEKINYKKNEIQASQHAYILEQLQQDIQNLVEEDLMKQYGVSIKDLTIEVEEETQVDEVSEDIKLITFHLEQKSDNHIDEIEIVSIPAKPKANKREDANSIKQTIATKLNLNTNQIKLVWGGAS